MLSAIEHPHCQRCRTGMVLVNSECRKDGSEKRMFECVKCHFLETKMVADRSKSPAIERLATNVRPPA
jgi:hypothetical protein